MFLIAMHSLFHSFGAVMENALSPKAELGLCSMRTKPILLFRSCLLTILIDFNSLM